MTQFSRRSFFAGLGALLATPAIAKVAALIPPLEAARVRSLNYLTLSQITRESVKMFVENNAFIANIDRQYADIFGQEPPKIGTQLRIRLPNEYRVS